jgi:hypothetical protein
VCIYDEVFCFYTDKNRRCEPGLRTIRNYAAHLVYVASIATTLLEVMKEAHDQHRQRSLHG